MSIILTWSIEGNLSLHILCVLASVIWHINHIFSGRIILSSVACHEGHEIRKSYWTQNLCCDFLYNFLFSVTLFILRRIERELHSNLCTCDWALPWLLSSSADPRNDSVRLRRFSLRENSFDAVTEKLVKFQLPDTLTVEILLHQSVVLQRAAMVGYKEYKRFDDGPLANFLWQERGGWFCETPCYFDNTSLLLEKFSKTWTILCLARWPVCCRCICK